MTHAKDIFSRPLFQATDGLGRLLVPRVGLERVRVGRDRTFVEAGLLFRLPDVPPERRGIGVHLGTDLVELPSQFAFSSVVEAVG